MTDHCSDIVTAILAPRKPQSRPLGLFLAESPCSRPAQAKSWCSAWARDSGFFIPRTMISHRAHCFLTRISLLHMTPRASQMLQPHFCGYAWLGSELTSPFVETSEEERRSHFHTGVIRTKNQLWGGLTRHCRIGAHSAFVERNSPAPYNLGVLCVVY